MESILGLLSLSADEGPYHFRNRGKAIYIWNEYLIGPSQYKNLLCIYKPLFEAWLLNRYIILLFSHQ